MGTTTTEGKREGLGEPFSYFVVVVGLVGHGWEGQLALLVAAQASSGPPPTSSARLAAAGQQLNAQQAAELQLSSQVHFRMLTAPRTPPTLLHNSPLTLSVLPRRRFDLLQR